MTAKLAPTWSRVLIRQALAPFGTPMDEHGRPLSKFGLVLVHGARGNQTREGTVLAVGPGQPHPKKKGVRFPMFGLQAGDYVYFKTAEEFTLDGEKLVITDIDNIEGVLEEAFAAE